MWKPPRACCATRSRPIRSISTRPCAALPRSKTTCAADRMAAPIDLSAQAALWFLIATLPIAFWVIWSDLRAMRIPNRAVLALLAVFVVLGPFLLPLELFAWQFLHLVVVLLVGIALNAAGVLGAGDAKFAAAAAPFVARGDIGLVMMLLAITLAAAFVTHRLAARSPL